MNIIQMRLLGLVKLPGDKLTIEEGLAAVRGLEFDYRQGNGRVVKAYVPDAKRKVGLTIKKLSDNTKKGFIVCINGSCYRKDTVNASYRRWTKIILQAVHSGAIVDERDLIMREGWGSGACPFGG